VEIEKLQEFILKRGWRLKIAKKTPIEQSLFIHAINELGAIQNYLETCPHPFNKLEIVKLYIASITHDCEKETEEWQGKIRVGEKPPHHANPEYARKFVNELIDFLKREKVEADFDQDDINDVISAQALHMSVAAKNPRVVFDELIRKHKTERWSEIAHLVDLFDDIVSLESVESSVELLNRNEYKMLNERLEFKYHKISNVRGILTSLLHRACEQVYEKHGFTPFLYFFDGTLYFRKKKNTFNERIGVDEIKESLMLTIDEFISRISPENEISAVIGRPQTKMLLIPELLRKESIDRYFVGIRRKYKNTRKPDRNKLRDVIEHHFGSIKNAKKNLNLENIKDVEIIDAVISNLKDLYDKYPDFCKEYQLVLDASSSRPQQYMFQFFKEIVHETLKDEEEFQREVKSEYDSVFGNDSYEVLKSKSTTMPYTVFDRRGNKQFPRDFERYVKPYREREIRINEELTTIKYLSLDAQEELLARNFSNILRNNLDKCKKLPKDLFFNKITGMLISSDLGYPLPLYADISKNAGKEIITLAKREVSSIGESKEKLFNETSGGRLCPLCHELMSSSNSLRADLLSDEIGVAKVFNNQAVGTCRFQSSVNVCLLCYAELLMRRVVLGKTPSDLLVLFPSLNFAKMQGSKVLERMKEIEDKLGRFFSYHNPNLNERVRLNDVREISSQILEKKAEEISAELSPDKFIESFRFEIGKEGKKSDLNRIETLLKDEWDSVGAFNKEFSANYETFQEVAEDIFEKRCQIPESERNYIIETANVNAIRYSFIYETPNFIVISLPFTFKYNEDEAEANITLKRLLFAFYMFLLTDCAVMIIPGKEVLHIPRTRKMVYVLPNSTLKQVMKEDWISLFDIEKWMIAVSAAVKLADEGRYSDRSGIFEVLIQPTAGHILSRIASQKTLSGSPKRADSRLINILDKLLMTGVLKNETIVNTKI